MKAADLADTREQAVGQVLIVDDLPNWRETLTDLLVADGHTVYAVAEPSQAMEFLFKKPVDVAILDLRLQDKDMYDVRGVQLLQEIRAKSPRTRVLMMTGFQSDGLLEKIPHVYEVDAFWLKNPVEHRFDIELFRQEIRALVEKSRQHDK
jgi:DNA-binding NtrC family response regulator